MIRLLVPVLFALFISGCGKTGPLYLPDADNEKNAHLTPLKKSVMENEVMSHG
ncbi:MAG: lipoprotein [Gammaproteobacteria bacterium]|nr:lipoprotein [Gammaproteobacteria bacterium]